MNTSEIRELSVLEIEMVSGGNWFADVASAFAHFADQMITAVVDALEWLMANFTVTYNSSDGSVIVQNK